MLQINVCKTGRYTVVKISPDLLTVKNALHKACVRHYCVYDVSLLCGLLEELTSE